MAEAFTTLKVLGTEVACYLRPGTECDLTALVRDLGSVCIECSSMEELRAMMESVADQHALALEYDAGSPVAADPRQQVVSVGFYPRS